MLGPDGNAGPVTTYRVKIDRTAPVTTDNAPAGWQDGDVTVTFSASDNASGLDRMRYRFHPETTWQFAYFTPGALTGVVPAGGLLVSGDGTHIIDYGSLDLAGNNEQNKSATVMIDTGPPVTTDNAPTRRVAGPILVTLTPYDAGAGMSGGVAKTEWSLDGVPGSGTSVMVSGDSVRTVTYHSTDAIGKVEGDRTATIQIGTPAGIAGVGGRCDVANRIHADDRLGRLRRWRRRDHHPLE